MGNLLMVNISRRKMTHPQELLTASNFPKGEHLPHVWDAVWLGLPPLFSSVFQVLVEVIRTHRSAFLLAIVSEIGVYQARTWLVPASSGLTHSCAHSHLCSRHLSSSLREALHKQMTQDHQKDVCTCTRARVPQRVHSGELVEPCDS